MSKTILFISERAIKENSILEENLESKLIRITLKEIQQLDLLPILGEKLYKDIEAEITTKIANDTYEMDADIKLLLDRYIKDFLTYGVLLNIPTSLNYKATNKGFLNITDANAKNIEGGEIENVKRYYRSKFDAYRLRLIEYVNKSCGIAVGQSPAQYSTGWYLTRQPDIVKIKEARHYKTGWRF